MVTGDSGSGKSSLVRAGLIPAFRGGRLGRPRAEGPDETIWHVIETRPSGDPFTLLADSVREAAERTGAAPSTASDLAGMVRTREPDKVRDAILSGAPKDPKRPCRILLVVDQFEEFRTSADAASYAAALVRLAAPGDDRIRVVLTMRRDYYYACASFPELYARIEQKAPSGRYLVHRMAPAGLASCIVEPLRLGGVGERDRTDLARAILKDVGDEPGELALLQMALWRTWAASRGRGPDLVRAYGDIGRVEGALAQAAEEVFARLDKENADRAETLFVRLVRPGESGGATRRVAQLAEFDEGTQKLAKYLAEQEQWRLLTLGEDTVEIAHEQLATQWLRFQRWLANAPGDPDQEVPPDPRGDDLRLLQALIAEASRWDAATPDTKPRSRATGVDLELYQQLERRRTTWLSAIERLFVADSGDADRIEKQRQLDERAERDRLAHERQVAAEALARSEQIRADEQSTAAAGLRRLVAAASAVAIVALVAAGGLYWFWQKSQSQQSALTQQAETLSATNTLLEAAKSAADVGRRAAEQAATVAVGNETRALAALADVAARKEDYLQSVKLTLAAWPRNAQDPRPRLRATIDTLGNSQKYQRQLVPAMRHEQGVSGAVLSGDESRVLSWSDDGTARLWDAASGRELVPAMRHEQGVSGAVLSGDESRVLSWSDDGTARLWDAASGRELVPAMRHEQGVSGAVLSGDESRVLSWSDDGTARLWDAASGRELVPAMRHEQSVRGAVLSGDESRVLSWSYDGTARLWDAASGRELVPAMRHEEGVRGAVLSGDESRVLSWSDDGTARLWDAASGRELVPAMRHDKSVSGAVLSGDESRVLSWSYDGTARLWDVSRIPKGNLLEVACALLPKPIDLTDVDGVYGIEIGDPICADTMPPPIWQEMQ